jgi:alkanesulfonate monooxygenase SsuD/methylene tetrahydromethanopterin reductase-like flavin-dependent oxidoreductase (luciferase family)
MKFGLGPFSMQAPPGSHETHAELYRTMLEQVVIAEEISFDSAWLVEHHFMEDGMCPSLLVTASVMAACTSKLIIGTSMYLLPLHRPVQTAKDVMLHFQK